MHVLNPFLPSVPMMTAYWCHSTDAGLQFCCFSGSTDVVCVSEHLEKILTYLLTYFSRVPGIFLQSGLRTNCDLWALRHSELAATSCKPSILHEHVQPLVKTAWPQLGHSSWLWRVYVDLCHTSAMRCRPSLTANSASSSSSTTL